MKIMYKNGMRVLMEDSTFGKLTYHSVVLISWGREEFPLEAGAYEELKHLIEIKNTIGFYSILRKIPPQRTSLLL